MLEFSTIQHVTFSLNKELLCANFQEYTGILGVFGLLERGAADGVLAELDAEQRLLREGLDATLVTATYTAWFVLHYLIASQFGHKIPKPNGKRLSYEYKKSRYSYHTSRQF